MLVICNPIMLLWCKLFLMFFQTHTSCKNLYGIAFPYYNDLMTIYGKDYATGKPAEGFVDAVSNMEKTAPAQVTLDSSDDEEDVVGDNATQTVESEAPRQKKQKLRKPPIKRELRKLFLLQVLKFLAYNLS